jgi:hypothetical protein
MLLIHYNGLPVCRLRAADYGELACMFDCIRAGEHVLVGKRKRDTEQARKLERLFNSGARFT